MLLGIDPLLSGDALATLRDMGHGDTIAIVDANFPAHYLGPPVIRMDTDLVRAGRAILSVMPLDGYVDAPVLRMEIDGRPKELGEAHEAFAAMVQEVAGAWPMGSIERFRFYEEARGCAAIFATLERRPYANMILVKGVIGPEGQVVRPERPARPARPRGVRP
ncbi:RbsD/FucU family protein [Benzoatithermus flavus]|uniref:RbsD/FucU domain-containing protein n=1 Tax=Benzoatithermus flavus TaxID=3108223 RepID=A0ABU8XML1_9PROT